MFSDFVLNGPDQLPCIRQIAFSPCGQILIAACDGGQIARFDSTNVN
jgi:hypothetical protein